VDEATTALRQHANHYVFISSIAVYKDFRQAGLREEYDLVSLDGDQAEWSYPEEKAAAERFVAERFPQNHTILRGGPIKGWRDPAVDVLYWCVKLQRYDAIIAPGSGRDHLQFIDVKDVGRFAISAAENHLVGAYNCTGPSAEPLTWRAFLEGARAQFDSGTELIWADERFLTDNNVAPFTELPLWTPISEDAFMQISNTKLVQTGFEFTRRDRTLSDCMEWYEKTMAKDLRFGSGATSIGLSRSKELALINALTG